MRVVLLYAPSLRQDSTYQDFCYTSHGTLAVTRNSSMGPPSGLFKLIEIFPILTTVENYCNKGCDAYKRSFAANQKD